MLVRHRNQIFNALKVDCERYQVDFSGIDFLDNELNNDFTLKVRSHPLHFFEVIDGHSKGISLRFRPDKDSTYFETNLDNIENAFSWIEDWIAALAYEQNTPDLWEEYAKSQTANAFTTTDNESLTQEEQNKAVWAIENVKARILELESNNREADEDLKACIDSHFCPYRRSCYESGEERLHPHVSSDGIQHYYKLDA